MIKKLMLSLCAVASTIGFTAQAQSGRSCATDEFHKAQVALHPEIKIEEDRLKADIERYVTGKVAAVPASRWAKTASLDSDAFLPWPQDTKEYHIPVVFHIIYDNNTSVGTNLPGTSAINISDNDIYGLVDRINKHYNATDPKLSGIINTWKPYAGNAHITFHLANKDPQGNPTRGILRHYSYASQGGDESAKIGQWPPNQYLNIYLENVIGRGAGKGTVQAYATFPTDYSTNPYSQGVISRADQADYPPTFGDEYTISHEIGHFLYLYHPWNSNGKEVEDTVCGDDEVDDTPPTVGHFSCGTNKLYDTACARNYFKAYDSATFNHMTGVGVIAANPPKTQIDTVLFDTTGSVGQTFTTTSASYPGVTRAMQSISVYVDTATGHNNGGSTIMRLYNGSGTSLLATSVNAVANKSMPWLTYYFNNIPLSANTTYKFVIVDTSTKNKSRFRLWKDTTDSYKGGQLYTGAGANTPMDSNLFFDIRQVPIINYPDTTVTQDIMDYSACPNEMFTKGQVARMRAALRSDVGYRNNLISGANLLRTGIWDTANNVALTPPDIKPIPLFNNTQFFTCRNSSQPVAFNDHSYGDTVSAYLWSFDKGGSANGATSKNVTSTFTDTGWVTVSLTVNGNGARAGDTATYTRNDVLYVADENGIQPAIEDFNPSAQLGRFPIFNYFKHPAYKWEFYNGAGFYDKTSIRFSNYDPRDENSVLTGAAVNTATQSPRGLYADFITPGYDLSGFGGECYVDFLSAGAFRTVKPASMNDTLLISYSTNCGVSWKTLGAISKGNLGNNGYVAEPFTPGGFEQWKEQSIPVPIIARTSETFFRFRFMPGTDNAYRYNGLDFGTGNNFYIDRLDVRENPAGVENGIIVRLGMSIVPNPTNGAATVRINGGDNSVADISVTDVTGKLVYHTSVARKSANTEVEIPASVLRVKGMYLVHVVTNGATETQKLIAY
jgi:hypothetical protein